ncbi:hypothetical protein KCP76_21765 [Salmonella enterica subsp. enterica serovar Weltevreden]|nr:hypothetical protein KCP76_21765 [Salmonella enterica subsp. enterica serovar Weltevreden]
MLNVESKRRCTSDWENQEKWKSGWIANQRQLQPRMGNRALLLVNLRQPACRVSATTTSRLITTTRTCIPRRKASISRSRVRCDYHGQRMDKITSGPNWEEILERRFENAKDQNFNMQKAMYGQFENTFMINLPRPHCGTVSTGVRGDLPGSCYLQA